MTVFAQMSLTEDYLLIVSSGEMATVEDGLDYIKDQIDMARETGMRRLLVDDTDLTVSLDYAEILTLADYWSRKGLPSMGLRIAALPPRNDPHGQRGYETAANNRSIVFKTFFDKEAAEAWLLKR